MRRRTYISATSAALIGGLAGCANPTNEDETDEEAGGEDETETTPAGGTTTEAETTVDETTEEDGETTTEGGEGTTEDGETTEEGEETTEEGETTAGGDGGSTQTVQMVTEDQTYYFDPIGLSVEPGTTVEWVNESGAHSSTAYAEGNGGAEVTRIPEDAEPWDSGTLTEGGATFSYTFEEEGTYDYFCIPHKALEMVGRVVCGEPGDVEGDPPDGSVPDAETIADQGSVSYDEFEG